MEFRVFSAKSAEDNDLSMACKPMTLVAAGGGYLPSSASEFSGEATSLVRIKCRDWFAEVFILPRHT